MPDRVEFSRLPRLTLVLGGARSGKSVFAEKLIEAAAPRALYIATATAGDDEMRERIARHRARRGAGWSTHEEPLEIARTLRTGHDRPVLVDCLTLWLANVMEAARAPETEFTALLAALAVIPGPVVLVANEVGLGIVPDNALAREFRDHAGRLNCAIAAAADRVVFLAAGLPMTLKDRVTAG